MTRYIDAYEIDRQYKALREQSYNSTDILTDSQILHLLLTAIDACPTADVVETMKCEECKHYDDGFCLNWDKVTEENGYCYEAKRNE